MNERVDGKISDVASAIRGSTEVSNLVAVVAATVGSQIESGFRDAYAAFRSGLITAYEFVEGMSDREFAAAERAVAFRA